MNRPKRNFASILIVAAMLCIPLSAQNRPEIAQQISGFKSPTAAAFSLDSRYLFVINHVQGDAGTMRGESSVSKLTVDEKGVVAMANPRFLTGLTAPIDLDFSPVAYGDIPKGAIFLVMGTPLVQNEAGRAMRDLSRVMVGLIVIDPNTGRVLKRIDVSPNSSIRLKNEGELSLSMLAPSSVCFDTEGNLYVGESGVGGHMFNRKQRGQPGILRIAADSVRQILEDQQPENVDLIRTTSLPTDMCYSDREDMLYFVTNHTQGRPSGSVFRISAGQYEGISSMQTVVRELEALTGVQLTPRGRVLLAGNSGELMFPKGKKNVRPLRFRPKHEFSSPGKLALLELGDGSMIIAVPEQSSDEGAGNGQRISIVKLPADA